MSEKIPVGYWFKVFSWENDWDVTRTVNIYGLTKEKAQLYYDIAMLLHDDAIPRLGNREYDEEIHGPIVRALLVKHQDTLKKMWDIELDFSDEINETDEEIGYTFNEIVHDLVGSSESYDYNRVVEWVKIFDVPFEVEYPDVTEQFKNG